MISGLNFHFDLEVLFTYKIKPYAFHDWEIRTRCAWYNQQTRFLTPTEEQKFYLLNIVIQSYGYDAVAVLLFLVLSKYDFSIYCLKCFEHLDIIKSELENACPGVVSYVDLLVVAAYESVILVSNHIHLPKLEPFPS